LSEECQILELFSSLVRILLPDYFYPTYSYNYDFAVLLGSSRGIGLGLVCRLLQYTNAIVIATCRHPEHATSLKELAQTYGDRLIVLPLEVTDSSQFTALLDALRQRSITSIDMVIANAGVATPDLNGDHASETTEHDMLHVFQTNVVGVMNTFQALRDIVLASETRVFAVMSSVMGSQTFVNTTGWATATSYRTSKTAANMFSICFAHDPAVKSRQGKVLCLHPGWVQTEMGGPNASIKVDDSAEGLVHVLDIAAGAQLGRDVIVGENFVKAQEAIKEKNTTFVSFNGELLSW
jgi:NAD(P)-dependent dehydrogenase (short-subunit alcohol dehydrogenase family)